MDGLFRIGVFYDGSHFNYAQNYFYGKGYGWLSFQQFQKLLEDYIRKHYQGDLEYKVVYAAWYQGLYTAPNSDEKRLKLDRQRHQDLLHAGIETKFQPMSASSKKEKGIDVAMAIDILEIALFDVFDLAVLVTGDGDFVPLVRSLNKHSKLVTVAYFDYEDNGHKSFCNERLKDACSLAINVNGLEKEKDYKATFKSLFKNHDKTVVAKDN
jgi:uncharacterized LabA/DUF88 family protein